MKSNKIKALAVLTMLIPIGLGIAICNIHNDTMFKYIGFTAAFIGGLAFGKLASMKI